MKTKTSAVLVLVLALCSQFANAETYLTASLGSYHFERGNGYCEVNPGLGLERDIAKSVRFLVGHYEGSKCLPISYLGASYMPLEIGRVRLGTALVGFMGYEKDRSKMIWAPLPVLSYETRKWGANLIILPPYDDFKGGIGLQVKFQLR